MGIVDAVRGKYFKKSFPMSTCVQAAALAKSGAIVEPECSASLNE